MIYRKFILGIIITSLFGFNVQAQTKGNPGGGNKPTATQAAKAPTSSKPRARPKSAKQKAASSARDAVRKIKKEQRTLNNKLSSVKRKISQVDRKIRNTSDTNKLIQLSGEKARLTKQNTELKKDKVKMSERRVKADRLSRRAVRTAKVERANIQLYKNDNKIANAKPKTTIKINEKPIGPSASPDGTQTLPPKGILKTSPDFASVTLQRIQRYPNGKIITPQK